MTQVHLHNCYGIIIEYKHAKNDKPAHYVLKYKYLKRKYPVPQQASRKTDEAQILLEQLYKDLSLSLPKNGFNLFALTDGVHVALPIQD